MAHPIRVIGIGPGSPEYITPAAVELIRSADILIGGERNLQAFAGLGKELFTIRNNLQEMAGFIKSRRQDSVIAVLASGDPGFYSVLEYLKKHFNKDELTVVPGISSVQLACARLCISWQDAAFYSVHGRNAGGLAELVRANDKVIILTDPDQTPAEIASELKAAGISDKKFFICENLSYSDEHVGEYDINSVPEGTGASGCVLIVTGG